MIYYCLIPHEKTPFLCNGVFCLLVGGVDRTEQNRTEQNRTMSYRSFLFLDEIQTHIDDSLLTPISYTYPYENIYKPFENICTQFSSKAIYHNNSLLCNSPHTVGNYMRPFGLLLFLLYSAYDPCLSKPSTSQLSLTQFVKRLVWCLRTGCIHSVVSKRLCVCFHARTLL